MNFNRHGVVLGVILICLILFNEVVGQSKSITTVKSFNEPLSNEGTLVRISAEITKQSLCQRGENINLDVTTQINVVNSGEKRIVLSRGGFKIQSLLLFTDLKSAKEEKFVADVARLGGFESIKLANRTPQNPQFLVLKRNKVVTFFSRNLLLLHTKDGGKNLVPPGNYVLTQHYRTWVWTPTLAEELQREWGKNRYLIWTNPILIETVPIKIGGFDRLPKCNNQINFGLG